MDSKQSLTGIELEKLYFEDKTNDHFNHPDLLKSLLNYELNKEDTIDSNTKMEIVDFCIEGLQRGTDIDQSKIQFLRDKHALIAKQEKKQHRNYVFGRIAAAAAVFVVVAGTLFLGTENEGKAGVFDWISRLTIREEDENLIISTPNMTLSKIEIKEGHLPEKLPDGFEFEFSETSDTSQTTIYKYCFKNVEGTSLFIQVTEVNDETAPNQLEFEIDKNSLTKKTVSNIPYYYNSNKDNNLISWTYHNQLFTIYGKFSFSELENIISYYQEVQLKE